MRLEIVVSIGHDSTLASAATIPVSPPAETSSGSLRAKMPLRCRSLVFAKVSSVFPPTFSCTLRAGDKPNARAPFPVSCTRSASPSL